MSDFAANPDRTLAQIREELRAEKNRNIELTEVLKDVLHEVEWLVFGPRRKGLTRAFERANEAVNGEE